MSDRIIGNFEKHADDSMKYVVYAGFEDVANCFNIPIDACLPCIEEIFANETLFDLMIQRGKMSDWRVSTPHGGPGTTLNGMLLYFLITHFKLNTVVETGVSGGYYTAFVLEALKTLENPSCVSIELENDDEVGKLVSKPYPDWWELNMGVDSVKFLQKHTPQASLYCHDSLHTMSHMTKEIMQFKKCNKDLFFVYIDDQDSDEFWQRSLQNKTFVKSGYNISGISGRESRLRGHLGGFLKFERVK